MSKFQFDPKLSFDGVALITAVAGMVFWFGGLKEQVAQVQKTSDSHSQKLEEMSQKQESLAQAVGLVRSDVSVLSAVVQERTGKPVEDQRGNGDK